MSGKGIAQKWAQAEAERAAREKQLAMLGAQAAQARIGKLAAEIQTEKKESAEENAREKEALKLQEAQAVRKIQQDWESLSVNDTWGPQVQRWSEDSMMLQKIIGCLRQATGKKIDNSL